MEQQSNYRNPKIPKDEKHLQQMLDALYADAKEKQARNKYPRQNGLLEIISSPITILTAYHNIKPNKGAMTPGNDGQTVRTLLEKPYEQAIGEIQSAMKNYRPQPIRRTFIPKPGKEEKRKLGIPSITDRIVQECVRMVIEPILEAQFFPYSFGFRPYREAAMALERVTDLVHKTGNYWVVEGDIKKYFDTMNHTRLIKQLWHMGIQDRRVLMLIKQMLKAGVMKESETNEIGTPQGGIISPLLANVYLNSFDWYIGKAWEFKRLKKQYNCKGARIRVQKKKTNLNAAYLIRYADDWVIVTDSKRHAEQWKWKAKEKLQRQYKLELSEEKTKITNVKEKTIHFLGFTFKVRKDAHAKLGYVTCTRPEIERLRMKIPQIKEQMKELGRCKNKIVQKNKIGKINATIRGIINYYRSATQVVAVMKKVSNSVNYLGKKIMKRKLGAKCIPAEKTDNLKNVHEGYKSQVPYVEVAGEKIGLTSLLFCRWKKAKQKNQKETPYTEEGRAIYQKRSKKSLSLPRRDAILQKHMEQTQKEHANSRIYNFEYYLNRAYAYNRDKGKCKVCGRALTEEDMVFHHNRPSLPTELVNRASNLASLCTRCHCEVHATARPKLSGKENRKIMRMREKLSMESHRNLMERRMKRKFHVRCESREKRDRTASKNARGSLLPIDACHSSRRIMGKPAIIINVIDKKNMIKEKEMTIQQLKTFCVVVEEKFFHRTAERLYMAQASVSQQIASLEKYYGVRLFVRRGWTFSVTPEGRALYKWAGEIVALVEAIPGNLEKLRTQSAGRLVLGASTLAGNYILPPIIKKFKEAYPRAELSVHTGYGNEMVDRIRQGSVDLAIVGKNLHWSNDAAVKFQPIATDSLSLIVARDHPFAARESVAPQELAEGQTFIHSRPGSAMRSMVEFYLKQENVLLKSILEMGNHETMKRSVAQGLGIALISTVCIAEEVASRRLVKVPLLHLDRVSREFVLASPRAREYYPLERAFVDILLDMLQVRAR